MIVLPRVRDLTLVIRSSVEEVGTGELEISFAGLEHSRPIFRFQIGEAVTVRGVPLAVPLVCDVVLHGHVSGELFGRFRIAGEANRETFEVDGSGTLVVRLRDGIAPMKPLEVARVVLQCGDHVLVRRGPLTEIRTYVQPGTVQDVLVSAEGRRACRLEGVEMRVGAPTVVDALLPGL